MRNHMTESWKVQDYKNSGLGVCQADDENEVICWMAGTKAKMSRDRVAEAELIADAPRLKAVNEELLRAMKCIHDRLKPFVVTYQHQSEKDALRWAKEAIAKAEGSGI